MQAMGRGLRVRALLATALTGFQATATGALIPPSQGHAHEYCFACRRSMSERC